MSSFDFEDVRDGKDVRVWRWCRLIGGPGAGEVVAVRVTCRNMYIPVKSNGDFKSVQYRRNGRVSTYFEYVEL